LRSCFCFSFVPRRAQWRTQGVLRCCCYCCCYWRRWRSYCNLRMPRRTPLSLTTPQRSLARSLLPRYTLLTHLVGSLLLSLSLSLSLSCDCLTASAEEIAELREKILYAELFVRTLALHRQIRESISPHTRSFHVGFVALPTPRCPRASHSATTTSACVTGRSRHRDSSSTTSTMYRSIGCSCHSTSRHVSCTRRSRCSASTEPLPQDGFPAQ